MACSARALEFAHRRLSALSVMSGLEKAEIYDRMYERLRHALILVHSFVSRPAAAALMPLLDLLTSLQVDSMEPVGTGVLYQQGDSLQDAGQAMDKEIGVILASKVQLALLLPVEEGLETRAAASLTELLQELGEDPRCCLVSLPAR